MPSAPLLILPALPAHRSRHHPLSKPAAPNLDAGTNSSNWHYNHIAPPLFHHRPRATRHSKLIQASWAQDLHHVPSSHGPSFTSSHPSLCRRYQLMPARAFSAADRAASPIHPSPSHHTLDSRLPRLLPCVAWCPSTLYRVSDVLVS